MEANEQLTGLANAQVVNSLRAVAEKKDTRGAPTNPIRPIITTPQPQPTTTGPKTGK